MSTSVFRNRTINRDFLKHKKKFFQELSKKSNYLPEETLKIVYSGLVRLIVQELRQSGAIRLPDLGDFWLAIAKPRIVGNLRHGKKFHVGQRRYIKFITDRKLKLYLKAMTGGVVYSGKSIKSKAEDFGL